MDTILLKFFAYSFISILIISCDNKIETHLKRVDKKLFYNNNAYDWEVLQYIDNQNQYIIFKYDGDTLKSLRFIPNEDDIPMISQYEMKFPCDRIDTCFVRIQEQDTLYFFRQGKNRKEFIVGEYAYRYTTLQLTTREMDFYEIHADSLRRIRGNNLPRFIE
jgi:hypothetical protein